MLVGVVGPSGAGKDTLMEGARARLAGDARFRFVRRCITRPAEAGSEDHEALSDAAFRERREAHGFALWWAAHGLLYGIPRAVEDDIAAGRVAVANLSRGVLVQAASRFPLRVLYITASEGLRAARLAARGREGALDIAGRLAPRDAPLPRDLDIETVFNDADVDSGVARVVSALTRAAADARR